MYLNFKHLKDLNIYTYVNICVFNYDIHLSLALRIDLTVLNFNLYTQNCTELKEIKILEPNRTPWDCRTGRLRYIYACIYQPVAVPAVGFVKEEWLFEMNVKIE